MLLLNKDNDTNVNVLLYIFLTLITWCLFYLYNRRKGNRIVYKLSDGWSSAVFCWAVLFVLIFQAGVSYPLTYYMNQLFQFGGNGGANTETAPLYILSATLFGPILEELLFRGGVLHAFLDNMKPKRAVLLSSLLFGLIHIVPGQVILGFTLGLLFGAIYSRTRNLGHTIVLHILTNTVAFCYGEFLFGHAAPHNSLHIFLPALAATIVITVLLVKQLRSTPVPTNL